MKNNYLYKNVIFKIFTFIGLLVITSSSMADWTMLGKGEGRTSYIDLSTIHKQGNLVKVWVLYDFLNEAETQDGYKFLSSAVQMEVNCEEEQIHIVLMSAYSKNMAQGITVMPNKESQNKWHSAAPNTGESNVMKVACGKVRLRSSN